LVISALEVGAQVVVKPAQDVLASIGQRHLRIPSPLKMAGELDGDIGRRLGSGSAPATLADERLV